MTRNGTQIPLKARVLFLAIFTIIVQTVYGDGYNYSVGGAITGGTISTPPSGAYYLSGAKVTFTCSRASDSDHRIHLPDCVEDDVPDSMSSNHPRWTASAGSFSDGDNRGTSVDWLASSSPSSNITICMYEDDLPNALYPDDTGTRDDDETLQNSKQINAIVPEPDQISFLDNVAGEEHDISGVSDPVWKRVSNPDNPACYTKNKKVKVEAKFWAASTLTEAEDVVVTVVDLGANALTFADKSGTFGTGWPSGTFDHVSNNNLTNSIGKTSLDLMWEYKCTYGSNATIAMWPFTDHTVYRIYGSPLCASGDFTKDHLDHSCNWGEGGTYVTENDIPKKIQENCWLNFDWGHLDDPWELETTEGDCTTHAELVAAALEVLGISADGTSQIGITRYCGTHRKWEYRFFVEVGPNGIETNFEGVCKVNLIDEATPWYCYYDKAMGLKGTDPAYQKGTLANMRNEWNSNPPPNYKVIHHYTYWDNH